MKKKIRSNHSLPEMLCEYILPVIVLIVLFRFIIFTGIVNSYSMYPNIKPNSLCFTNRMAYVVRTPQRGEIILFSSDETEEKYICKRIIGLPGDEISFKNGYVYLNGIICEETYLDESVESNCTSEFIVPDNMYFVLGDNRENSLDSRYFANPYIKKSNIIGKVFGVIELPK